jgi:hypothetical protein
MGAFSRSEIRAARSARGSRGRRTRALLHLACVCALVGCNYRHSAPVRASDLPPPPGERELHSSPLIVEVVPTTDDSQCVAYERYRTLCFHRVRAALEKALTQGLWPSFPEVRVGRAQDAGPRDYVLQIDAHLDALPPGPEGPGWSAAATGRWRLLRGGEVLAEEAVASRSRAEFPYGAALGEAGSEVLDALGVHVVAAVSKIEEREPLPARPLPPVVARAIPEPQPPPETEKPEGAEATEAPPPASSTNDRPQDPQSEDAQSQDGQPQDGQPQDGQPSDGPSHDA